MPAPVSFAFTDEQDELRRTVRAFLADRSPPAEVRRLMATEEGYDPAVWVVLAGQLGLCGLAVPEEHGGAGYGFVELAIVFEEMGRALLCAPFLSTVALAAGALLHSGDPAAMADLLPPIAAGETVATLALVEDGGGWDPDAVTLAATPGAGGWTLDGHKTNVVDGHVAGLVLVAARAPGGVSLFAVDGSAAGLVRTRLPTMDQTRKQARLELTGVAARLVGPEGGGAEPVRRALALGAVALAAEQVGGAQRVLEMAVDHARTRYQFGRPIGSFQAVKHKCADMLLEVESARSAAWYAAGEAAAGTDDLPLAASLAKAYCSDAYLHAAAENVQIHGGIGFTWEHDAHLYLKRAKSSQLLFGDPTYHRGLIAQRLGV